MSTSYAVAAILIMALVTYLPRMLPITIFQKKIHSKFVQSFLHYVPYAVLSALTIPDILYATNNYSTACVGFAVACILSYFEKNLVVVASGAILSVYLCGLFL